MEAAQEQHAQTVAALRSQLEEKEAEREAAAAEAAAAAAKVAAAEGRAAEAVTPVEGLGLCQGQG